MKKFLQKYVYIIISVLICTNSIVACNYYNLNNKYEKANTKYEQCLKENKKLSKENKELKSSNNELKSVNTQFSQRQQSLIDERNKLQTKYDSASAQLASLQNQQSTIDDLNKQLESKNQAITDLQAKLKQYTDSSSITSHASNEKTTTNNSYTVYITENGSKYHTGSCGYLWNSKIAIDKNKAIAQGYSPCSRCHP